ncbi:hypothetical protein [Streptomyces phaeochromogenes]
MSAFIQQLPALIGVMVGALGSYLAIARGDQIRFRREQTARWEERRLTVYSAAVLLRGARRSGPSAGAFGAVDL